MGPLATSEGIISNELGQESHDTVGAVVMDFEGHVSAATSTGGLNGKAKGRIGDSPLAGAGLFADDKLGNFNQLWMNTKSLQDLQETAKEKSYAKHASLPQKRLSFDYSNSTGVEQGSRSKAYKGLGTKLWKWA